MALCDREGFEERIRRIGLFDAEEHLYKTDNEKIVNPLFYQHIHRNIVYISPPKGKRIRKELPNFEFEAAPNPFRPGSGGAPTEKPL